MITHRDQRASCPTSCPVSCPASCPGVRTCPPSRESCPHADLRKHGFKAGLIKTLSCPTLSRLGRENPQAGSPCEGTVRMDRIKDGTLGNRPRSTRRVIEASKLGRSLDQTNLQDSVANLRCLLACSMTIRQAHPRSVELGGVNG